jgi:hypothetical protein
LFHLTYQIYQASRLGLHNLDISKLFIIILISLGWTVVWTLFNFFKLKYLLVKSIASNSIDLIFAILKGLTIVLFTFMGLTFTQGISLIRNHGYLGLASQNYFHIAFDNYNDVEFTRLNIYNDGF